MARTLLVITTGGTIDKQYPPDKGSYAFEFGTPAAYRIIKRARASIQNIVNLPAKDSLDIHTDEREHIARVCATAQQEAIVITHGTDTMIDTAESISRLELPKYIVLTGAAQPECMKEADADFNLGGAIAAARSLPNPGVYVAMNGLVMPWNSCTKRDDGYFVEK